MKAQRLVMGMPITVEVRDGGAEPLVEWVFDWFGAVDRLFSTYKQESAISRLNSGELEREDAPELVQRVLRRCEELRAETGGYFDAWRAGQVDPSGYVKGWAVWEAAKQVRAAGVRDYYIEAGGDIQAHGGPWRVGIRNPFARGEIVKVLTIEDGAVATSGAYERGSHIYDPHTGRAPAGVASVTVVGPRIDEADVWATAGFAAGAQAAEVVARAGLECYTIGHDGTARFTPGLPLAKGV